MFNQLKRIMITCGICTSFLFVALATSQAEDNYCTGVTMVKAGALTVNATPKNSVRLLNNRDDCGDWVINTSKWYYLDGSNQDAMLATALTSLAAGSKVTVISKGGNVYTNWGTLVMLTAETPE